MTDTITILGIAGGLRHSSFNTALLRAAAAATPAGCTGTSTCQKPWHAYGARISASVLKC
jgi:hypothetical protein